MYSAQKQISSKYRFFLWIMLLLPGFNAFTADKVRNLSSQLQQQLDQTRKQYGLNAMALTIIAPKISAKPLNFVSGSTQKAKGRPLLTSDYFQIGSNTKSFVAALLLKLQTDKVLSLDDPVTQWLPEYKHWKQVRIRNLLHNNSGLKSYTQTQGFLKAMEGSEKKQFTPEELLAYSYKEKPLFKPGQGWDYSNTNWVLAGMIAEKATHHSLAWLFKTRFLSAKQLNLSNTLYAPYRYDKPVLERLIHGYTDENQDVSGRNMSWAASAGAMLASNEDLAWWAYDLFHKKALNSDELAQMQALVSTKDGHTLSENSEEGYGLGIGFKITKAGPNWGHEGHTLGYHSIFAWFPEEDITIAANASGLKNSDFQDFITKIVFILKDSKKKQALL